MPTMPAKEEPGSSGEMNLSADQPSITIVDHRGDLILTARKNSFSEEIAFRVCSNTVFRASTNLERLSRESTVRLGDQKVVRLRDVNPTALHTILNILHGHFAQVFPRFSDKRHLCDVLTFTHQFDMTHCLAPVAEKWFAESYDIKRTFNFEAFATQLWICHELGYIGCTRALLRTLLVNAHLNSDGQLSWRSSSGPEREHRVLRTFEPLGMIGKNI